MPSVAESTVYPDGVSWDQRLTVDLSRFADGREHVAKVYVYAAQFFQGWGDHPNNAWEWGHFSASDQTTPAAFTLKFTLGQTPSPSPAPAPSGLYSPAEAKQRIVAEVEKYRQGRADSAVAGTRLYLIELLALDRDDARWKRVGPEMFRLLRS
jgi:hypothetical protein